MIVKETIQIGRVHILKQTVCPNPAHDKEMKRITVMGWRAFRKHGDVMNCNLPLSLKRKVHNRRVLPVLRHGSETWHRTKEKDRKLRRGQR